MSEPLITRSSVTHSSVIPVNAFMPETDTKQWSDYIDCTDTAQIVQQRYMQASAFYFANMTEVEKTRAAKAHKILIEIADLELCIRSLKESIDVIDVCKSMTKKYEVYSAWQGKNILKDYMLNTGEVGFAVKIINTMIGHIEEGRLADLKKELDMLRLERCP